MGSKRMQGPDAHLKCSKTFALVLDYLTKHIPLIDEERHDDYDKNATCLTPLQEHIEDTVKEIACILADDSTGALSGNWTNSFLIILALFDPPQVRN